ncbi:Uncharacterised protein [Mycobacteroides abscessus subsp. massiliense]|nr:Uncharacterised protein [Mycobacteroides abscessus subsp. massiliense]
MQLQLGGKSPELLFDFVESLRRPVHQIHLVDAQHHVLDAEQRGDERMSPCLLGQPVTGVDENDRQVRGRRPGHHIAGVLLVTGSVCDDEFACGR